MDLSARSQRKINDIIEHASRLFVRHGYQKVTMESIAQYANVSKVTLYKYFSDKQALYEHIIKTNSDKDYLDVKEIVSDFITYPQKVYKLFQLMVENYFNVERPNHDTSIILSLDTEKFLRRHTTRMKKQRYKLYNQGRMEEFICENINDQVLENYYMIILSGWIQKHSSIGKLTDEDLNLLYKTLFCGILSCNSET